MVWFDASLLVLVFNYERQSTININLVLVIKTKGINWAKLRGFNIGFD